MYALRNAAASIAVAAMTSLGSAMPFSTPAKAQGLFGGVTGEGCRAFQRAGGEFWQGYFRGRGESPFLSDDGLYVVREYRCFRSKAECDDWLYDVQSAHVTTSRTWCRQYFG